MPTSVQTEITISQGAETYDIPRRSLSRAAERGQIPYRRIGSLYVLDAEAVRLYAKSTQPAVSLMPTSHPRPADMAARAPRQTGLAEIVAFNGGTVTVKCCHCGRLHQRARSMVGSRHVVAGCHRGHGQCREYRLVNLRGGRR